MTAGLPAGSPDDASAWWARPYGEGRLLAGFLTTDEIQGLYPAAIHWPASTADHVRRICNATSSMSPRPDQEQACLSPVEESEALEMLDPISRSLAAGPEIPIGYAWVELRNLIVTRAIADPLPSAVTLVPDDVRALAEHSLTGPLSALTGGTDGRVFWTAPVVPTLKSITLEGDELVVRYQPIRLLNYASLIVVGYEGGRLYLINQYGRVLHALEHGIERLLCLVYYGLDLDAADLGIRLPGLQGTPLNHFGRARLLGACTPLMRDFLDPTVSVSIPMREPIFGTLFSVQSMAAAFDMSPIVPVPLPPRSIPTAMEMEGEAHDHAG